MSNEFVKIVRKEIAGKVVEVSVLLITCPNNVLREKETSETVKMSIP